MNIVFLDAATVGSTSLSPIEELGRLTTYATTSPHQLAERVQDADIIITNKVVLDAETISNAINLKLICVAATGTNCVDHAAAATYQIPVKNVAGYSTAGVCQHVIGMMINLASNLHRYAAESSQWPASPIFTRLDHSMSELTGKTLGIAGMGAIGQSVAKVAEALGMNVIALERAGQTSDSGNRQPAESFFANSDYISLHCPLTEDTKYMINQQTLSQMKPTAFLINTGRGDLINETDLLQALHQGTIAGAALDVLSVEPPALDHPLMDSSLKNLFITPHTAWATSESRVKLIAGIASNINQFQA